MKGIKKSIAEDLYKSLYPQSSQPGIMYGSSKTHKPLVNGFNKLRSILSAYNTDTYKWANFFVPLFQHLTSNEFILKDPFEFAKIICEHKTGLFMPFLDVYFLFSSVPLEGIVNMSYSKVTVVFIVLTKNELAKYFL